MFGSKDSGQLRWCLAAFCFVWAAAFAGIASAGKNKVTICHFPPGNPANYQQISIDAAGLAAHLAHGDFIRARCASDCNVNKTLVTPPLILVPSGRHLRCFDRTLPVSTTTRYDGVYRSERVELRFVCKWRVCFRFKLSIVGNL